MAGILESLRSGVWVTRERTRLVALAVLAAFTIGFGYLIVTADGYVDRQGRPLGTDFSNVYAAGTLVVEGRPEAPFDPALQHQREQVIFGADTPFYGWHYPPFFLFIAAVLALMPYGLALATWQAVTFALYLLSIRAIVSGAMVGAAVRDPLWLLLAVGFPAVYVNLGHGHNGFLTAALLGSALLVLDRRPIVSGVLFGLIAYKPQFGLMIPIVLAATGRWRTFAAAGATVAALVLAATAAFGLDIWNAFLTSTLFTRVVVLEAGDTGWYKIQSIFAWTRMWGGTVGIAYAMQAALVTALGAALVWLWRSAAAYPLKAAALVIAAMLATPYSLDYDLMMLAPALALLAADGLARGFLSWERTALALLWLMPLVARSVAEWTLLPVGVLMMLAVFALVLRRAMIDVAASGRLLSHVAS
jgi:alpha-1,2-mannosyltransferase